MKLHLGAEDIGLYIQDQATRATQRIPIAARELSRIREDAQAVQSTVGNTLAKLQEDASVGSAPAALAAIEELDVVKARMEAACTTLKEASGLSTLFRLVDDLFAAGDLPRIAETLAGIQRSLAVVADSVAEFRDGPRRLAALQDRFAAAVEGPLSAALVGQRGDETASLVGMLSSLGRGDMVSRAYVAARSPPLHALWEGYTPGTPLVPWLSTFYDQILHSVASECEWCRATLPEVFPSLVLELLSAFFTAIDKPHRARLAGALTGSAGSLLPLEHLEQAVAAAADFAEGLRRELEEAGAVKDGSAGALSALLTLVLAPVEGAVVQYPDKELQYLGGEFTRLIAAAREAAGPGGQTLAAALASTVDSAFATASAATARCVKLTGGTALPPLARALDRALQQYIAAVQATIEASRRAPVGLDGKPLAAPTAAAPEALLPLLLVVSKLQTKLTECIQGLAQSASAALTPLLAASSQQQGMHVASPVSLPVLRLAAQPALRRELSSFLALSASSPPLVGAETVSRELAATVNSLVESALLAKLRPHFAGLPALPELQAQPATSAPLPTFTPYPLQYVTAAGEYLMMLPQLLESALNADSGAQSGANAEGEGQDGESGAPAQLVAEWVDRVALAGARLYQDQLMKVKALTPQGAGQLAADIEYFCNVLSTLGLSAPPALAAWQAALVAADAQELESVLGLAAGSGGSQGAAAAVETVARLRRMNISAPAVAAVP